MSGSLPTRFVRAAAAAWTLALAMASVAVAQPQAPPTPAPITFPDGFTVPVPPVRKGAALPAPGAPPALPPGADAITPATWRVTVRSASPDGRVRSVVQTVSRSAERVHIALADGNEWLFERNPVDPRRASAFAILHPSRTVVVYSDADLRALLGVSGWAQVLTFGCRSGELSPTGCDARDGRSRLLVELVTSGVDASLLTLAPERFPTYREMSVADWLEAH